MQDFSDFDSLALFTRVVQAGSLAGAERATGVPKATLSRRLTVLERALDTQLIRRTRKGVVLPRTLVASPGFLAGHSPISTPEDLAGVAALAISRDILAWDLTEPDGTEIAVQPAIVFSTNRQTILADAAIAGLGAANLPTFLVEEAIHDRRLVRVLPDWTSSAVAMTALWQQDRITTRLVAVIVDAFVQVFAHGFSRNGRPAGT